MMTCLMIARQLELILPKYEIPKIIFALRQDNLIWDIVSDKSFLDHLINWEGSDQAEFWKPSTIALINYYYENNIPYGELTCKNIIDSIDEKKYQLFDQLIHTIHKTESITDGITTACIFAQKKQECPNWDNIFQEIFSKVIYTEKQFIDVWQSGLTCLFGMIDDFSQIEKIIFRHFPFHNTFLLLHKILLSNQVNEENASRHLSHLFMDLSSKEKMEVIRYLSLRKYLNSAVFYTKILKSEIPESVEITGQSSDHNRIDLADWFGLNSLVETIQYDLNALNVHKKILPNYYGNSKGDSDLFRDIFIAENIANQADTENSSILARTAIERITRLSDEEFFENAGISTYLIDPLAPLKSLGNMGFHKEAVELGRYLMEIFPFFQPIYFHMSSIFEQLNNKEQQIEMAEFGSYCIYGDFSGNRKLAEISEKSGLWQKSLTERRYIVEASKLPYVQDLYAYGNSALNNENYELAIGIGLRIIEDYPNHGWSCLLIGESYLSMNYANQAIPFLNRAALLMENEVKPWVLLIEAYSKINDQVLRYHTIISAVSRFSKNSSIMMEHAKYHLDNLQKDDGYKILRELIINPDLPADTVLSVGNLYEVNGDIDTAIVIYQGFKEKWPEIVEFDLRLGINYYNLGGFDKAILNLDRYLNIHPGNLNIWILYLQAIESQGDVNPWFDNGPSFQSSCCFMENINKACTNILSIDPENLHSRIVLAEWFLMESRYEEALGIYKELQGDAARLTDDEIWRLLAGSGVAELAVGNYEKAAGILESAVNLKPTNFIAVAKLAEAYACSESVEKALELGFQYLQKNRSNPHIIPWYFSFINKYTNDLVGASFIDRVIKSGPVSFETSINLAEMHIQNGLHENAKSVLDSIPNDDNISVSNARCVADLYYRLGDYVSAWNLIITAIEISQSTDFELLTDAVGILIKKRAFGEAVHYLQQIITTTPDDAALFTLMGDVTAASGEISTAIDMLVKASELTNLSVINNIQNDCGKNFKYLPREYTRNLGLKKNIFLRLSKLFRYQGNLKKSLEYARLCVGLDPDHLPTINFTVELASQLLEYDLLIELALKVKEYTGTESIDRSHENIGEYILAVVNLDCVLCEHELSIGNFEEAESIFTGLNSLGCNNLRVKLLEIRINSSNKNRDTLVSDFHNLIVENNTGNRSDYSDYIFEGDDSLYRTEDQNTWIINTALGLSMLETAYNLAKTEILNSPHSPLSCHNLIKVIAYCLEEKVLSDDLDFSGNQIFFESYSNQFQNDLNQAFNFLDNYPDLDQNDINLSKRILTGLIEPGSINGEEFASVRIEPQWAILLSSIYQKRGNHKELIMLTEKFPNHPRILINAALGLYLDDWDKAYKLAHSAVHSERENIMGHIALAKICEYKGKFKEAYERVQLALTYYPEEPIWHKNAARLASNLEKPADAIYHLQKTMNSFPGNLSLKIELGLAMVQNNQPELAADHFLTCQEECPDDYRLSVGLAKAYSAAGNFDQAAVWIENAIQKAPEIFETWMAAAFIAYDSGNRKLAIEYAEKMYAMQKNNIDVISAYSILIEKSGQLEKACLVMEEAVRNIREIPIDFFMRYVDLVAKYKGSKAALDAMELKRYSFLNQPEFLKKYSLYHFNVGMNQQAELYAFQVQKIEPSYPGINHLLALIYKSKGFIDMTEKFLRDEIKKNPKDCLESYIELAEIQKNKSDFTQALKTYRLAMDLYPNEFMAYYQTGLILKEYKDFEAAEKMLTRAVELSPENNKIRRQLAAVAALNLVHNSQEALLANDL